MKTYYFLLILLMSILCGCFSHYAQEKKVKVDGLEIYKLTHFEFHYLLVYDKKSNYRFTYPVGYRDHEFTGGEGPVFEAHKFFPESKKSWWLTTSNTNSTVCFLDWCHSKKGTLIGLSLKDTLLFSKVDSFCKKNYTFYKLDITKFKNWYIPD